MTGLRLYCVGTSSKVSVLLVGQGLEDTTTLHGVLRVLVGCVSKVRGHPASSDQLHQCLMVGRCAEFCTRMAVMPDWIAAHCAAVKLLLFSIFEHPALAVHPLVSAIDGVTFRVCVFTKA